MDKSTGPGQAAKFLRQLTLRVSESVVRQVVTELLKRDDRVLYGLYALQVDKPASVCGKGTVYKIKSLFDEGRLGPYLDYLTAYNTELVEPDCHGEIDPAQQASLTKVSSSKDIYQLLHTWYLQLEKNSAELSLTSLFKSLIPSEQLLRRILFPDSSLSQTDRVGPLYRKTFMRQSTALGNPLRISLPVSQDPLFGLLEQILQGTRVMSLDAQWGESSVKYVKIVDDWLYSVSDMVASYIRVRLEQASIDVTRLEFELLVQQ